MEKTTILFNPSAGSGRAAACREALASGLRRPGLRFEIVVTESEAHLRALTRRLACERGAGILAGAGGDSTFSIMAAEIVRSGAGPDVRLGMIGLGSSNDIPAAFGLGTIEAACAALARGRTRRIDAGVIRAERPVRGAAWAGRLPGTCAERTRQGSETPDAPSELQPEAGKGLPDGGRVGAATRGGSFGTDGDVVESVFLGQANIGLGAFVNRYVAELAKRAPAAAKRQWLAGVRGVRSAYRSGAVPLPLRIESDDGTVEGEFDVAVFGNTRLWATGRPIVPAADPGDGLLDACLIRASSFLRLCRIARLSRRGRHGRDPRVSFLRSPAFRIASDRPFAVQADGELVGEAGCPNEFRDVTIAVLPGALALVA